MTDLNSIKFDSPEESWFYNWCIELKENGFIDSFEYHPEKFILFEGVKGKISKQTKKGIKKEERTLLSHKSYTADFKIFWNEKSRNILFQDIDEFENEIPLFVSHERCSWIDIKGSFSQNESYTKFESDRKWTWEKYKIFVNKTIVTGKKESLFLQTFCPKGLEDELFFKKKSGEPRKWLSKLKDYSIKNFDRWIAEINKGKKEAGYE